MQSKTMILARPFGLAVGAALAVASIATADAAPRKKYRAATKITKIVRSAPPAGIQRPTGEIYLSKGRGQLVNLAAPITDVFVSNTAAVDVQVNSPTQLYVFGKDDGEASVYATTRSGQVAYSTNVLVSQNVSSLDQMLRLAMPDTDVKSTMAGRVAVLTGTVKSPDDIQQAGDLARTYLNPGVDLSAPSPQLKVLVVNRLRTATPLQVRLEVRIAEVSRSFTKNIGINWSTFDNSSTLPLGGFSQGRDPGTVSVDPATGVRTFTFTPPPAGSSGLRLGARFLGLDVLGALDLGESEGFVTTLASPTLTTLSGEKATFLAGGEVPLIYTVTSNGGNTQTVEFKPYGVTVDFLPTVLADGRISLQVKPEVSEIDRTVQTQGIFGFTTRRVDTTVELGSGQSFVIGGLMRATNNNNFAKTPGAGDVPILGALFRSNAYQRGESELLIVVTPYLVKPVPANQIVLPTDGYRTPSELSRIFGGKLYEGTTQKRPVPTVAPAKTVPADALGAAKGSTIAPGFSN